MLSFLCCSAFVDMNVKVLYALDLKYKSSCRTVGLLMKWVILSHIEVSMQHVQSTRTLGLSCYLEIALWVTSLYSFCRAGTLSSVLKDCLVYLLPGWGKDLGAHSAFLAKAQGLLCAATVVSIHERGCDVLMQSTLVSILVLFYPPDGSDQLPSQ